jgi:hypothetical protein
MDLQLVVSHSRWARKFRRSFTAGPILLIACSAMALIVNEGAYPCFIASLSMIAIFPAPCYRQSRGFSVEAQREAVRRYLVSHDGE